jgi:hypothetical protein
MPCAKTYGDNLILELALDIWWRFTMTDLRCFGFHVAFVCPYGFWTQGFISWC